MGSRSRALAIAMALGAAAPGAGVAQDAPAGPVVLPATIPIFPLPDLALFPNGTQPFHIFEPRYRAMIADALAGDSIIGMVMLQPGYEVDYEGRPPVFSVGAAGVIVASERLADGRYDIVLRGVGKFRIVGEDWSRAYRLAEIEVVREVEADDPELLASRRRQVEAAVRAAFPRAPLPAPGVPDERAIDDIATMLPFGRAQRLELIEAEGPLERAAILVRLLGSGSRA